MDKDHLIELISNSLLYESKNSDSTRNLSDFKNYLEIGVRDGRNFEKILTKY